MIDDEKPAVRITTGETAKGRTQFSVYLYGRCIMSKLTESTADCLVADINIILKQRQEKQNEQKTKTT